MTIDANSQQKILSQWNDFVKDDERIKGYCDFDNQRIEAIKGIKGFIDSFNKGKIDLKNFKSTLDGYNKQHNHWGFTAIKGQMFFNQLFKTSNNVNALSSLITDCISEPVDIHDAGTKIERLEQYTRKIYENADDKRKVPNPASCSYFLSYFWQIHDYQKWPVFYTSLIESLENLKIWKKSQKQADGYLCFYEIVNEIKDFLSEYTKKDLSHWDVEHCFWWNERESITDESKTESDGHGVSLIENTSFEYTDYIPPIVANLIEAGRLRGEKTVAKGKDYEQLVALLFKMLGFDVDELGQGKGRAPDAIVKYRPENVAFVIDAKVRPEGYSIGTDDRAIKEYINRYIVKLKQDGYKKTSFIIVSTSFNGDPQKFIEEITLETDIKRVTLLTSEALLYLLSYKLSEGIGISDLVDAILKNGIIKASDISESFVDL